MYISEFLQILLILPNFADPDPSEALRRGGGDAALPAGRRVCATPAHLAKSCLADKEANEIMD